MNIKLQLFFMITMFCTSMVTQARTFNVNSQTQFDNALSNANAGDEIVWRNGTYSDIFMDIDKNGITVRAASNGGVIFNGASRVEIDANDVTLSGLQFLGGDISGSKDVILLEGNNCTLTQLNIKDYVSRKYLTINSSSKRGLVSFCNFENRRTRAEQNIVQVNVSRNGPNFHVFRRCSFRNFEGRGNGQDFGVEPLRIGTMAQSVNDSRTTVEFCYFTQCNGDGEIISSKSNQNIFRFNTFEDNPFGELVLRHGQQAVVYGNFFLDGLGGIRVKEGKKHSIYNNYFDGLTGRAIMVQNNTYDPVGDVLIAFNTIIDSAPVILEDRDGEATPEDIVFANNIFTKPRGSLFTNPTGNETWIGNFAKGNLGISRPSGILNGDLKLRKRQGIYQLSDGSVAINAAKSGFRSIESISGIDFDRAIRFDVVDRQRPRAVGSRDVGCQEYKPNKLIKPIATSSNTGPSYLNNGTSLQANIFTILQSETQESPDRGLGLQTFPNPVQNETNLVFELQEEKSVTIAIYDLRGALRQTILDNSLRPSGSVNVPIDLSPFESGAYIVKVDSGTESMSKIIIKE